MLLHLNLGSNMAPRRDHIMRAIGLLADTRDVTIAGCSRIYESPAVGLAEPAGPFYNICVALRTSLGAHKILQRAQDIEVRVGRSPAEKGRALARVIDIDLVLADQLVLDTPELTLPHPGLPWRSFFLWPLLEINPGARDPRNGVALRHHAQTAVSPPILGTHPGFMI